MPFMCRGRQTGGLVEMVQRAGRAQIKLNDCICPHCQRTAWHIIGQSSRRQALQQVFRPWLFFTGRPKDREVSLHWCRLTCPLPREQLSSPQAPHRTSALAPPPPTSPPEEPPVLTGMLTLDLECQNAKAHFCQICPV